MKWKDLADGVTYDLPEDYADATVVRRRAWAARRARLKELRDAVATRSLTAGELRELVAALIRHIGLED